MAREFNIYCQESREGLLKLRTRFADLQGAWNDAQYRRFREDLERLSTGIIRLLEELEESQLRHLLSLADHLEDYERLGPPSHGSLQVNIFQGANNIILGGS